MKKNTTQIKKIIQFSKAPPHLWIILLAMMTYVAFFNILFSIFVQTGINMVSSGFSDTRFIRYSVLFCIASIGYAFAAYTFGVYQEKIVQTIAQANKKRMIDQLFCIPYSTYEKYEKGDLQTRIFDDCDQVSHMLVYTVLPVVQVLLSVAFGLAYVLFYNWQMGVFTMLWIPLFYKWNQKCSRSIQKSFMNIEKAESRLKDFAERYYDNNPVVRIFHLSDLLKQKNKDIYDEKMKYVKKNASSMGKMVGGTETGVRILEILNLVIGVYFVYQGQLSIGTLIGIWNITIGTIAYSAADLPEMISGLSMQSVSLERLDEIAALSREPDHAQHQPDRSENYDLVLKDLGFSYPNRPMVLEGITQQFNGSDIHYIIGESGSGKSTLMKILLGLYTPDHGSVYVQDRTGSKAADQGIRGCLAYVPQGSSLLNLSISENISMGKPISRQAIEQACRQANIHDWIVSLPKGYDTVLHIDQHPSQGQAQRIAIARALALGYKTLLMDEPFSALDKDNIENLASWLEKKDSLGAIIISHEETSRRIAAHVFELKGGHLYESTVL